MKKIIGLFFAFALFVLLAQSVFAGMREFSDLDNSLYRDSIVWLAENEVVRGYEDGSFGVDKCVNRVEFLKMLFLMTGVDVDSYEADLFKDTPAGEWYAPYLKTARSKGVVNGYPDGSFKPGDCVNRAEAVKMAVLEFFGEVPSYRAYYGYVDDLDRVQWYYDHLDYALSARALGLGHIRGIESLEFDFFPGEPMSRAEVSEMLYRLKAIRDNGLEYYSFWAEPNDISFTPFYLSCEYSPDVALRDYDPQDLVPSDLSIVGFVDHANSAQLDNLDAIWDKVPDSGILDMFLDEIGGDNDFLDLSRGEWKLFFGLKADEDLDDFAVYVVAQAEDGDKLERAIGNMLHKDMRSSISCEDRNKFEFWTSEFDEFFGFRYGNMLFATNKSEERTEAVRRILLGQKSGLSLGEVSNKLAYLYLDSNYLDFMFEDFDLGLGSYALFDDLAFSVSAEKDGFMMSVESQLSGESSLWDSYRDYVLSLIHKVPAEGLIAYVEEPNLAELVKMLAYWDYSTWGIYYDEVPMTDLEVYEGFLEGFAEIYEFDAGVLGEILDSAFAVSVSDVGEGYPALTMYLDLGSGKKASAQLFSELIDRLVDEMILDMEDEMIVVSDVEGHPALKRIEWAFEEEVADDLNLVYGLPVVSSSSFYEFYYGLMSDNVYVFALYPDFPLMYAKNVLADSVEYKEAVSQLKGVYGNDFTYVNFAPLFYLIDRNLGLFEFDEDTLEIYELIKEYLLVVKHVASSTKVEGDLMRSNTFVAF